MAQLSAYTTPILLVLIAAIGITGMYMSSGATDSLSILESEPALTGAGVRILESSEIPSPWGIQRPIRTFSSFPGPITSPTPMHPNDKVLSPGNGTISFRLVPNWDMNDNIAHGFFQTQSRSGEGWANEANRITIFKWTNNNLYFRRMGSTGIFNDIILKPTDIVPGTTLKIQEFFKSGQAVDIHWTWSSNGQSTVSLNGKKAATQSRLNQPPISVQTAYRFGIGHEKDVSGTITNAIVNSSTSNPSSNLYISRLMNLRVEANSKGAPLLSYDADPADLTICYTGVSSAADSESKIALSTKCGERSVVVGSGATYSIELSSANFQKTPSTNPPTGFSFEAGKSYYLRVEATDPSANDRSSEYLKYTFPGDVSPTPTNPSDKGSHLGPITAPTEAYSSAGVLSPDKGTISFRLVPNWNMTDNLAHGFFQTGKEWKNQANRITIFKHSNNNLYFRRIGPFGIINDIILKPGDTIPGTTEKLQDVVKSGRAVNIHWTWSNDGNSVVYLNGIKVSSDAQATLSLDGKLVKTKSKTTIRPASIESVYRLGIGHDKTVDGTISKGVILAATSIPSCRKTGGLGSHLHCEPSILTDNLQA